MRIHKQKSIGAILLFLFIFQFCFTYVGPAYAEGTVAHVSESAESLNRLIQYYNGQERLGDWEAFGLRNAGIEVSDKYSAGNLASSTDKARTILGGIAAGKDVSGYVYELESCQKGRSDGAIMLEGETLNATIWSAFALEYAKINGYECQYDRDKALSYIADKQFENGGFNEWGGNEADVDSTAHALIALSYAKDKYSDRIDGGMEYLLSKQLTDGLFDNWGPSVESTASVIEAIYALGETFDTRPWKGDMVAAILQYQLPNGEFYWAADSEKKPNDFTTRCALQALVDLNNSNSKYHNLLPQIKEPDDIPPGPKPEEPKNPTDPIVEKSLAYLSIKGDGGPILSLSPIEFTDDLTVFDLLRKTLEKNGISYTATNDGYVSEINGLRERKPGYPNSGWKYKVNGIVASVGAGAYLVNNGDRIEWFYTLDYTQDEDYKKNAAVEEQKLTENQEKAKGELRQYANELSTLAKKSVLLNQEDRMNAEQAKEIKDKLDKNNVTLRQEATEKESIITDRENEVCLIIPEQALSRNTEITVQERKTDAVPEHGSMKVYSSIYNFGPNGTKFDKPVTISLKIPISEDIDIEQLTPAWYDEEKKEWIPIPALIDLKIGMVVFQLDHFTKFAVITRTDEKPKELVKPVFSDVGENLSWAKGAIEDLAAKGIISGTGKGCFEPYRLISRAEAMQILTRALGKQSTEAKVSFTDVHSRDWFYPAIQTACSQGWVSGLPDGSFRPKSNMSRYEMAVVLDKAAGLQDKDLNVAKPLTENMPIWARDSVERCYQAGIIKGKADGLFHGEESVTRAEAAQILYQLLKSDLIKS